MAAITVLVTFYSRDGATERLAHAAAVGAVQARAAIRLRRVPDADPAAAIERFPRSKESLQRMHREYVAPRDADVLAADALIFATRDDVDASSGEWSSLVAMLERLHAEGKLAGKAAGAVPGGASDSLASLIRRLELMAPGASEGDAVERAVALGRAVVSVAEGLKRSR